MTDLFEAPEVQPTAQVTVNSADQLLSSIVNEQGKPKYSTVEDALKGLLNAQAHIKTIQEENQLLREATTKAKTMEELVAALKPSPEVVPNPTPKTQEIDIEKVIEAKLSALELKKREDANINTVVSKLKEVHGDKASEQFYADAAALGFDKATINDLAKKSPSAVFKLLGIQEKAPVTNPAGVRTDALNVPATDKKRGAMSHGSSEQLVNHWRESKAKTNAKFGI